MNVYEFASHPNQRRIKIRKENLKFGDFTAVNSEVLFQAMKSLTACAFKVYLYFASNADDYSFWLSSSHLCKTTGISNSSYTKAFKELCDKGYLEPSGERGKESDCTYTFYERPCYRANPYY